MASDTKIDDGGPAVVCRKCRRDFDPKPWQLVKADYECPACKRARQNAANAADPTFKEKVRRRNAMPNVKQALRDYAARRRATDPHYATIRAARRKVATEIEAGRLVRGSCEVCGAPNAEAHHEDYGKPLEVRWLCKRHHAAADAMLAARKQPTT